MLLNNAIESEINHLRFNTKYVQAHNQVSNNGITNLIIIPSIRLPSCWNAEISTLLFIVDDYGKFGYSLPKSFWLDIKDLRCYNRRMRYMVNETYISEFPQWKDLSGFKWHLQAWDNNSTLLTIINAIRLSLDISLDQFNRFLI